MNIRFSQSRLVSFIGLIVEILFFLSLTLLLSLPAIRWTFGKLPTHLMSYPFVIKLSSVVALIGILHLAIHRSRLRSVLASKTDPLTKRFKGAHLVFAILLIALSFAFLSHRIVDFDLVNDEYQVFSTAYGYLQSGDFMLFDFCRNDFSGERYTRAFPHTWLVAQSFRLFGVSELSARIVSVFFGALFSIAGYFVTFYFTRSRLAAVFVSLACILHPSISVIFRLTRMYSILLPVFLMAYFSIHYTLRYMGEPRHNRQRLLALILGSLSLTVFAMLIHINSGVIFPSLLFYVLYLAATERKAGYVVSSILGLICVGIVFGVWTLTDILTPIAHHVSPLATVHLQYFRDLFQSPFKLPFGITAYLLALSLIFFTRKTDTGRNIVSLLLLNLTGVLFFVYFARRYYAFKYMSFLVPTSTILIVLVFYLLLRMFRFRWMQVLMVVLALTNLVDSMSDPVRYEWQRPKFKEAYALIKENFDFERNELLVYQYLRCYYMRETLPHMRQLNLGRKQELEYSSFIRSISDAPSGWVVWNVKKEGHVKRKIWRLIRTCFKRQNESTDQWNGVEVYRFDQNQSCLINRRRMPSRIKRLTSENRNYIEMSQPFTISFWVRSDRPAPGAPLALGGELAQGLIVDTPAEPGKEGIRFRYFRGNACGAISTGPVFDGKWHHVVLYQEGGIVGLKYGVSVDGNTVGECPLRTPKEERARFLVNNFQGDIQNIRLFDDQLTRGQIRSLYYAGVGNLKPEINDDTGTPFSPVVLWKNTNVND